jgi:hypothetical protein
MKKRISVLQELLPLPFGSCFYICAGMFLCGCVVGVFLAMRVQSDSTTVYTLSQAMDAFRTGEYESDYFAQYWGLMSFFIPIFLCALCVPGVLAVPILSALRGVSIAFTCCLAARVCGGGVLAPFAIVGPGTFLSLPLFLLLAAVSLSYAASLSSAVFSRRRDMRRVVFSPYIFLFLCTTGLCALFALLDQLLVPYFAARLLAVF